MHLAPCFTVIGEDGIAMDDPAESRPLANRTVVITRAMAQASDFAAELEKYGAMVAACPTIEIAEPESYAPLDEAIDNLYGYDWLVFTSVNGVHYFLQRLHDRRHQTAELDQLKVCAIGAAGQHCSQTTAIDVLGNNCSISWNNIGPRAGRLQRHR